MLSSIVIFGTIFDHLLFSILNGDKSHHHSIYGKWLWTYLRNRWSWDSVRKRTPCNVVLCVNFCKGSCGFGISCSQKSKDMKNDILCYSLVHIIYYQNSRFVMLSSNLPPPSYHLSKVLYQTSCLVSEFKS